MKDFILKQNLFYQEGSEINLGWFFQPNVPEKLLKTGRMDVLEFLSHFAPAKQQFTKSILNKIGFKRNEVSLIVDITLPSNIGGYWDLNSTIAINPLYLMAADEATIASILIHEGIHAGMYSESEVHDESLTEAMTKKMMREVYHRDGISTAYDPMVDMLNDFIGPLTFEEVVELIEAGDTATLDNLLDLMVLGDDLNEKAPENFVWENIYSDLAKSWKLVQKLFPRITNKIKGQYEDVHGKSNMGVHDYKLDGLLEKAAEKVSKDSEMMANIFFYSFQNVKNITSLEEAKKRVVDEGFAYLFDFQDETIQQYLLKFLDIFNMHLATGQMIDKNDAIDQLRELALLS